MLIEEGRRAGLTYRELGEQLNITRDQVRVLDYHRLRRSDEVKESILGLLGAVTLSTYGQSFLSSYDVHFPETFTCQPLYERLPKRSFL